MENNAWEKIDKGTLLRLRNGDEMAFNALYWKYSSYVYNFIVSLLYDPTIAEDLTQNVFLKIWERHEDIDPEKGIDNYMFTIARHLVYQETEERMKLIIGPNEIEGLKEMSDNSLEENIDATSLESYLQSVVNQLPSARKEIFQLSRIHHLSNKEIADKLSISEKTVENQITRALKFLKEQLSKDSILLILILLLIGKC